MYIRNNPIDCILYIIEKKYSDVKFDISFDVFEEEESSAAGMTIFPENESDIPRILINSSIPFEAVTEIIAHEFAHILDVKENGIKKTEEEAHNEKWDKKFEELLELYDKTIEDFVVNREKYEKLKREV